MKVGFVGLGKLGLPVCMAMCERGQKVLGYDINPKASEATPHEEGWGTLSFPELVQYHKKMGNFEQVGLSRVLDECSIIFVAVQTPHDERYDGTGLLPPERKDFDYGYLDSAVTDIIDISGKSQPLIVVVSTVLPGTIDRLYGKFDARIIYSPSFIAMGTTIKDFLEPEMVLCGHHNNDDDATEYENLIREMGIEAPFLRMNVVEAELTKVIYNTFIGMKIVFANTIMEICHKAGGNAKVVTDAIKMANRRLISPAYLSPGMGDGGACHPRDNIAMSWLARDLGLSYDIFEKVMECRQAQAEWLCHRVASFGLPIIVLGTAFKADSPLQTGSSAWLCVNILNSWGHNVITIDEPHDEYPVGAYLIGCNHSWMKDVKFPQGSMVVDPWGCIS